MVEQEMKREMGKWLMDVAKYMFTALLISTIFADMEQPVVIYCALLSEQKMNTIIIAGSLALFATVVGLYFLYHDSHHNQQQMMTE